MLMRYSFNFIIFNNLNKFLIQVYYIGSKKAFLPALDGKKGSEEILNAILPPREYIETGK